MRDLLVEGDEAHVVLWVSSRLGRANQADSITLGLETSGVVVAIAHILAVVHTGNNNGNMNEVSNGVEQAEVASSARVFLPYDCTFEYHFRGC